MRYRLNYSNLKHKCSPIELEGASGVCSRVMTWLRRRGHGVLLHSGAFQCESVPARFFYEILCWMSFLLVRLYTMFSSVSFGVVEQRINLLFKVAARELLVIPSTL